jgi:hypothetical protein
VTPSAESRNSAPSRLKPTATNRVPVQVTSIKSIATGTSVSCQDAWTGFVVAVGLEVKLGVATCVGEGGGRLAAGDAASCVAVVSAEQAAMKIATNSEAGQRRRTSPRVIAASRSTRPRQ